MKRSWIGFLISCGLLVTLVWAEQQQMVEFYAFPPVTITDPFHVRRLTVGDGYMTINNPPANSMIVEGALGIRMVNPDAAAVALEIARDTSGIFGGVVRFRGAGSNRGFELRNIEGNLYFFTDDGSGNYTGDKLRIINNGSVYLAASLLGTKTPRAPLEIGPRDATNQGGKLLMAEAGTNRYYSIENHTGKVSIRTEDASGDSEKIRILNNGSVGLFPLGNSADADPQAPLHLGPTNSTTDGGEMLWAEADPARPYFKIKNVSGDLRLSSESGGDRMIVTNGGTWGIGTLNPSSDVKLHVVGSTRIGRTGTVTPESSREKMGFGLSTPTAGVHTKGSTGLLIEGPTDPATSKTPYAFQAVVNGVQTDLRIGEESPANSGNAATRIVIHPIGGGDAYVGVNLTTPAFPFDVGLGGNAAMFFGEDNVVFGSGSPRSGYKLTVNGIGYATGSFSPISSVSYKTDVTRLDPVQEQGLFSRMTHLPVYRFRGKDGNIPPQQREIGILAEEAPAELLNDEGEGISYSDYLAALVAVLKSQQAQIKSLKQELDRLEAEER
ncbi:MAG: hypothetical protein NC819_02330 [Candidatus Omnitrophica bacterium]|nr:hypothetical protein [Candidatus Omnitrophota bacterium]